MLTGLLDDGAAGLSVVHRYGGHCLVQDPGDADFPSMPTAALRAVPEDQRQRDLAELESALGRSPVLPDGSPTGDASPYGCPHCHGVLNTVPEATVLRFRCRTRHAWSAESLVAQQDGDVEEAHRTALRVLEERAQMRRRLAETATAAGRGRSQEHFLSRAKDADRSAELLRAVLRQESDQPTLPTSASGP